MDFVEIWSYVVGFLIFIINIIKNFFLLFGSFRFLVLNTKMCQGFSLFDNFVPQQHNTVAYLPLSTPVALKAGCQSQSLGLPRTVKIFFFP